MSVDVITVDWFNIGIAALVAIAVVTLLALLFSGRRRND
jgi:hypothetical protein